MQRIDVRERRSRTPRPAFRVVRALLQAVADTGQKEQVSQWLPTASAVPTMSVARAQVRPTPACQRQPTAVTAWMITPERDAPRLAGCDRQARQPLVRPPSRDVAQRPQPGWPDPEHGPADTVDSLVQQPRDEQQDHRAPGQCPCGMRPQAAARVWRELSLRRKGPIRWVEARGTSFWKAMTQSCSN